MKAMRRVAYVIFVLGPAVLTIILAVFRYASHPRLPMETALLNGLLVVLLWHFALLYKHRDIPGFLVYAVFNIFLFFVMLAGELTLP